MRTDQLSKSARPRVAAYVTTIAIALGTVVVTAFFTDTPLLAAQKERYSIRTSASELDKERVQVTVEIRDGAKSDALVAAPTVIVHRGEAAKASTSYMDDGVERRFETEITFIEQGNGEARVRAWENGVVVQDQKVKFMASLPVRQRSEPISLSLRDADIHDLMRTFARLTGRSITVDVAVKGNVTIDLHDVPWPEALAEAARLVGADVREEDGQIYIERPGRRRPAHDSADPNSRRFTMSTTIPAPKAPASTAVPLSEGITPPKLVIRIDPKYTEDAKAARIAGMVIIATEIDELGNVASAEVRKPLPFGLSEAALEAVKQWKFEPAMKDGKPLRVKFNVTVNFKPDDV